MILTFVLQKKRIPVKIERGTGGMNDVDISWIPQETLNVMSMFLSVLLEVTTSLSLPQYSFTFQSFSLVSPYE